MTGATDASTGGGMDGSIHGTAWAIAASVTDPELPALTLEDLGVLRQVEEHCAEDHGGTGHAGRCRTSVTVVITPTYSGCPALAAMRDDLVRALTRAGYAGVRVAVELRPAWSSDWISERGRLALAAAGISAPGPVPPRDGGPVPLTLLPARRELRCPRCGSAAAELVSEFGATACKALYRCASCAEPFEHMKEI
jgi:ring-1,2-phenylacetyl-CoA epoxidase subunit PaaD